MRSSLDRYLKEKNYPVSIISSDEFKESNKVSEGKARDLRDKGMKNRPNCSLPLATQEEEILWQCGQLGHENAQSLINSLWWLMTLLCLKILKFIQVMTANAITYCPKKEQNPGKVD